MLVAANGNVESECVIYNGGNGSAWGPVILPVFKTGGRHLRDVVGVFDSHTLPPISAMYAQHMAVFAQAPSLRGSQDAAQGA